MLQSLSHQIAGAELAAFHQHVYGVNVSRDWRLITDVPLKYFPAFVCYYPAIILSPLEFSK